jgi:hypothetical protein
VPGPDTEVADSVAAMISGTAGAAGARARRALARTGQLVEAPVCSPRGRTCRAAADPAGAGPADLGRLLALDRAKTLRRKLTSNQPAARRGAALHRAHAAARPDALGFRHIHVDLPTSHLAGHATADADVDWWSPRLGLGFRL